jgi:hypothetical protein
MPRAMARGRGRSPERDFESGRIGLDGPSWEPVERSDLRPDRPCPPPSGPTGRDTSGPDWLDFASVLSPRTPGAPADARRPLLDALAPDGAIHDAHSR